MWRYINFCWEKSNNPIVTSTLWLIVQLITRPWLLTTKACLNDREPSLITHAFQTIDLTELVYSRCFYSDPPPPHRQSSFPGPWDGYTASFYIILYKTTLTFCILNHIVIYNYAIQKQSIVDWCTGDGWTNGRKRKIL